MVDEDAGEMIADGAADERGGDRGIHAARKAQDDAFIADLLPQAFDGGVDEARHGPVTFTAADGEEEIL